MSIYVGNLPNEVIQNDLNSVFAEYGTVKRVQLPTDRKTGQPRGFSFVEIEAEYTQIGAVDGTKCVESPKVSKAQATRKKKSGWW